MKLKSAYDDHMPASDETGLLCLDPSLAIQEARDECDINTIVTRFGLTGKLPDDIRLPTYGDFSGINDYREALHAVMQAEDAFMSLTADIRSRFHNDPAAFVDFCSNDANRDELRKLGLLKPEIVVDKVVTAPS